MSKQTIINRTVDSQWQPEYQYTDNIDKAVLAICNDYEGFILKEMQDKGKRGEDYSSFVEEYNTKEELEIIEDLKREGILVNRVEYDRYIVTTDNVDTNANLKDLPDIWNKFVLRSK